MDNFKQVNDGLGHQYGDVLLQEIANSLRTIPQIANSCYRMGGDEFVIIVRPEVFGDITYVVDKISSMFNNPWKLMEVDYYCTMSMGLAIFPEDAVHGQDLIKCADYAMYEAKKNGKNRYCWYGEVKTSKDEQQEELENTIRKAVDDKCREFELNYQPIVDMEGKLTGVEALIRFNSTKFGRMMPMDFISVAEYLGLGAHIGDYVFEEACRTLKDWNNSIAPDLKMYINVSAIQLMAVNAVEKILGIIETTGVNPQNIVLDISESMEFRDSTRAYSTIDILHAHGIKVALDDFGAGDASMDRIRKYNAYVVKIDKNFIEGAAKDKYRSAVIEALSVMSSSMNFLLCFEGVETDTQKQFALESGAELMAGYLYGKPGSKDKIEEWMK